MLAIFGYIVLAFVSTLLIALTLAGLVNKEEARELMEKWYPNERR